MRSQEIANDVSALLRARTPLLWIVTREEARVEGYLMEAAAAAGYMARTWDVGQGVAEMGGRKVNIGGIGADDILRAIDARADGGGDRCAWILRDLPPWLDGLAGAQVCRLLNNLARKLPGIGKADAQAVIVITPQAEIPPELAGHATVIEWPLPDREEIGDYLDAAIAGLPEDRRVDAAPNGTRDAAIDAAVGLTAEEAQGCFAASLVRSGKIEPATVSREKKRVIARERVLEWFDPLPAGLDAVGGLDVLKTWLRSRQAAYTPAARAYGLPAPKGCLLVGIPGCGKSLTAKAIATAWGCPLLKIDLGALKSKFVGESEANLRKALAVIAAIGRCVVWLDELEKALAGATQGGADGGVSADVLGTILTWMQERQGEAFVIATSNDVEGLPPELLRKGRFDELWFIDLPNREERVEILLASLRAFGRDGKVFNDTREISQIADCTEGFTGAEIAAIIPDALFSAFADAAREPNYRDLLDAAATVTPLAKTAATKIARLRTWADGKARRATSPQAAQVVDTPRARAIEL